MNRLFYVVNTGPKGLTRVPSFAGNTLDQLNPGSSEGRRYGERKAFELIIVRIGQRRRTLGRSRGLSPFIQTLSLTTFLPVNGKVSFFYSRLLLYRRIDIEKKFLYFLSKPTYRLPSGAIELLSNFIQKTGFGSGIRLFFYCFFHRHEPPLLFSGEWAPQSQDLVLCFLPFVKYNVWRELLEEHNQTLP